MRGIAKPDHACMDRSASCASQRSGRF